MQGQRHTDAAAAANNSASLTAATLQKCGSQQPTHTHTNVFLSHSGLTLHPAATLPSEYSKRGKVDLRSESNDAAEGKETRLR